MDSPNSNPQHSDHHASGSGGPIKPSTPAIGSNSPPTSCKKRKEEEEAAIKAAHSMPLPTKRHHTEGNEKDEEVNLLKSIIEFHKRNGKYPSSDIEKFYQDWKKGGHGVCNNAMELDAKVVELQARFLKNSRMYGHDVDGKMDPIDIEIFRLSHRIWGVSDDNDGSPLEEKPVVDLNPIDLKKEQETNDDDHDDIGVDIKDSSEQETDDDEDDNTEDYSTEEDSDESHISCYITTDSTSYSTHDEDDYNTEDSESSSEEETDYDSSEGSEDSSSKEVSSSKDSSEQETGDESAYDDDDDTKAKAKQESGGHKEVEYHIQQHTQVREDSLSPEPTPKVTMVRANVRRMVVLSIIPPSHHHSDSSTKSSKEDDGSGDDSKRSSSSSS